MSNFYNVSHFNTLIGNEKGDIDHPQWDLLKSQLALILEEVSELVEAVETKDTTEMRDAIADILVTTYGMAHRLGCDADMDMTEVHRSNMSKFCSTVDETVETGVKYETQGLRVRSNHINGLTAIVSAADQTDANGKFIPKGKLFKSVNFSEPAFQ